MDAIRVSFTRLLEGSLLSKIWQLCLLVVGIFTMYFVTIFTQQCVKLRNFSGPLAFPLIGNCYQSQALFLMRYLSTLRKRFGKIFTFFAFTKPYLVICDPAVVRRVLSDSKSFIKGLDYTKQFSIAFGEGLVTSNGEKHRKDRMHFGKYFTKMNIGKHMGMVNKKTRMTIESMLLDVNSHKCDPQNKDKYPNGDTCKPTDSTGKCYNIEHFFALLALRIFMQFAISYDFATDTTEDKSDMEEYLAKAVSDGSWAIGRMITLGLPMWDIFPAVQVVKEGKRVLWDEMKKVVMNRRKALERGECLDVDDCITPMINENMSEKEMSDHMVTLLSAGHDTTAYFSSYMFYLLSQHQDVQQKLREEIETVIGDREEIDCDDVMSLKYLLMVMQETLRMYSIIPCVTRTCTVDTYIKESGITLPAGQDLLIPMFLINRDPELWENPSQFMPERFEGCTGYFTSSKAGFFPFGYGSRACIGNYLAQMESAVFVCKLLKAFDVLPEPEFKPAIFAGISLTTSNGINIRLRAR